MKNKLLPIKHYKFWLMPSPFGAFLSFVAIPYLSEQFGEILLGGLKETER
jgi:hypothetical protein